MLLIYNFHFYLSNNHSLKTLLYQLKHVAAFTNATKKLCIDRSYC